MECDSFCHTLYTSAAYLNILSKCEYSAINILYTPNGYLNCWLGLVSHSIIIFRTTLIWSKRKLRETQRKTNDFYRFRSSREINIHNKIMKMKTFFFFSFFFERHNICAIDGIDWNKNSNGTGENGYDEIPQSTEQSVDKIIKKDK